MGIYNHLWGASNLFSYKSIWEWKVICITWICITRSRRDIPECHFHLNLLKSDYWRCRAAEQGENGLHYKVLGKRPAINQTSRLNVKQAFVKWKKPAPIKYMKQLFVKAVANSRAGFTEYKPVKLLKQYRRKLCLLMAYKYTGWHHLSNFHSIEKL